MKSTFSTIFFSTLLAAALTTSCNYNSNGVEAHGTDSSATKAAADSSKAATDRENARLAAVDTLVMGVDVDEKQDQIDWAAAKAGGVDFMYARATKGANGEDGRFKANWDASKREGVHRGAYHQFVIGHDNATQLKNFQKHAILETGDLMPAVRIDGGSVPPNVRVDRKAAQKAMSGFLTEVENAFGCAPLVFTDADFANNYLTDPAFGKYPLWIVSPNTETPTLPNVWQGKAWTLWLFSDSGTLPGFTENVARTKYYSSSTEFAAEMPCAKP